MLSQKTQQRKRNKLRRRRAVPRLASALTSSQSSALSCTAGSCTSTVTSNSRVLKDGLVLVGTVLDETRQDTNYTEMKSLENCRRRRAVSRSALASTLSQSSKLSSAGSCTSTVTFNSRVFDDNLVLVGTVLEETKQDTNDIEDLINEDFRKL